MLWEVLCQKKKGKNKKLAKSKTRKGGLSQKWASRWIENPKGRSRKKLGAYKNIFPMDWKPERAIQAKVRDLQKNNTKKWWWKKKQQKNKTKTKTEASQFKWVKRKKSLCVGLQMETSVRLFDWWGFIPRNGDFCLWFDWWRLLPPVVWLMASFACNLTKWRLLPEWLIDDDFC